MKNTAPSSSPPPPSFHSKSPHFIPMVHTSERTEQEDDSTATTPKNNPTPLHRYVKSSISCNKCRPHVREKFSVVPLDNNGVPKLSFSMASPNAIFKSFVSSLSKKTPKSSESTAREEQWKIALSELSHKVVQATRKRDEAVLEVSKLKHSMAELEKKLNKLEIYCQGLKSGFNGGLVSDSLIENFLVSVSESRSAIRQLSRCLTLQLRQMGSKVYERIQFLLQPHNIKISLSKNPKTILVFYLEALLNRAFFEDFESIGFQRNSATRILNPSERSAANLASFNLLNELTWEEVLSKGTKHFSEEFSRFCDRKMSEIVAMLEWNRAWPEQVLQAFFAAAKSVWLVHLLAGAGKPCFAVLRIECGVRFDGVYMEDVAGEKTGDLVPATVRIMVAPGFYVYDNLIKCKVLCRYYTNHND